MCACRCAPARARAPTRHSFPPARCRNYCGATTATITITAGTHRRRNGRQRLHDGDAHGPCACGHHDPQLEVHAESTEGVTGLAQHCMKSFTTQARVEPATSPHLRAPGTRARRRSAPPCRTGPPWSRRWAPASRVAAGSVGKGAAVAAAGSGAAAAAAASAPEAAAAGALLAGRATHPADGHLDAHGAPLHDLLCGRRQAGRAGLLRGACRVHGGSAALPRRGRGGAGARMHTRARAGHHSLEVPSILKLAGVPMMPGSGVSDTPARRRRAVTWRAPRCRRRRYCCCSPSTPLAHL